MTTPLFTLVGFALWTITLLIGTIGVHRWSLILTKRAPIQSFRADAVEGPDRYRRSMRAHANCIENLPVFGALVVVATLLGLESLLLDALSVTVLCARVCQSSVHVAFVETTRTVAVRFGFFAVQLLCMFAMGFVVIQAG